MTEQEILAQLPAFFPALLQKQYSSADVSRILAGCAAQRRVTLRANSLRATRQEVQAALAREGIAAAAVPYYADAFLLPEATEADVRALPEYEQGKVYLQSLSSMLPPLLLAPQPGQDILDMAAAPGGKTTQMAALTGGKARITACERNALRAERLKYNLTRQGAGGVTVLVSDARQLNDWFSFDAVLLDAPCSGSGTLRAGMAPKGFTQALVEKCVRQQAGLLQKAAKLLKPGCEMVYSTCSVLAAENEAQIKKLLRTGRVELVALQAPWLEQLPQLPTSLPGTLCVCPTEQYEGFFVAKLRRLR